MPNRVSNWKVEWNVLDQVTKQYAHLPFVAPVPKHADVLKTELYRVSIFDLAPAGAVAKRFMELAEHVLHDGTDVTLTGENANARIAAWH